MTVIKRDRNASRESLIKELSKFCELLETQGEEDAIEYLNEAKKLLLDNTLGTPEVQQAVKMVLNAFDGDHELNAYTHTRDNKGDWGEAEELALASSRVLNLAKRLG